jgi:hypothetical protein
MGISRLTTNAIGAMTHHGKKRPQAKLSSAISKVLTRNFIIIIIHWRALLKNAAPISPVCPIGLPWPITHTGK